MIDYVLLDLLHVFDWLILDWLPFYIHDRTRVKYFDFDGLWAISGKIYKNVAL